MVDNPHTEHAEAQPHPTPAGQYYLMEKIAQGGMAEIFKGLSYDINGIKKTVCIKKILPHIAASQEFIDSLIDEAKIAVSLSHGNIAQIYDLGKVGDDYFMVMEFVEGRSLSHIHKRCQKNDTLIPVPYLCYIIAEMLNGLNYIHRRTDEHGHTLGIVHRDISPQNIMVSYAGTVKIIDFGIAKAKIRTGITDSGILKGKFAYMSPEQARGDSTDHRSDIFSLGIIFHEMLTGERLFKADDNRQTLKNVRRAKVELPSKLRGELPAELDEIVMRALARDRRERYPFASEMHDELVKFLYTTYPDFKPSDISTFVTEMFKDDLSASGAEDAKTPYLIIDHTNSALIDRAQFEDTGIMQAPVDMKPYLVGDRPTPAREETTPAVEAVESDEPDGAIAMDEISRTSPLERLKNISLKKIGIAAAAAFVIAGGAFGIRYALTRPPAPPPLAGATGNLFITTAPPDAEIFMNGDLAGSGSPVTVTDVPANTSRLLRVERKGYITQQRRIRMSEGEFRNLSFTLAPEVAPTGTISVSSTPPGATIFLNDVETHHRTPATITDVAVERKHTLGLHLENHQFWTARFTARPNETQNFHVQLAVDYGSLEITTEPTGALVLLDGAPIGQTPLTRDRLEPGKIYHIEVWREGYEPQTHDVRINAGRLEQMRLTLKPAPSPPAAPQPTPAPETQPPAATAPPAIEIAPMGPAGF